VPIKRVYNTVEFGIPNEIIQKYSETAWKFYWQKKFGKLDFVIFDGGKVAK
jgi:hypothetical protein